jgi:hypothetical protein
LHDATAEVLSELLRIHKYAARGELIPVVHRLERLRLVVLALERYLHHNGYFTPHDSDKWVSRDLGADLMKQLRPTFPELEPRAIAHALRLLLHLALSLMRELDVDSETSGQLWRLYEELEEEIHSYLLRLATT